MPPFIVEYLSPQAFKIHETTNQLLDMDRWMTLSVNYKAGLSEFFRYSTYVMFYVLTVQLLRKKGTLQSTVLTIAVFGGLLAFSSILQFYLTENMALWFRSTPSNAIAMGPYVNRNHYAGLMELIFPVVLGVFLFYRPRIGNTSVVKGIVEIFSQEKANIHILIGASALLIIISIFVSLSRGAMISTCFSLIIFMLFLLKQKISKGNTILMLGVIILAALSIGWFGWDQIIERFAKLKNAQGIIYEFRVEFWKDSQDIFKQYPITGSGIGTFPHVYPLHRSFTQPFFLSHAHNDYLELLVEGGMIGFLFAASFLLTLFYKTYKVFSKRRDAFSIYLYIGCITAMVSILFHSFTDFNMHIGANGLWFFFIAGIAVSAANTGLRKQSQETRLIPVNSLTTKISSGVIIFVVVICTVLYNISDLTGRFYYSNIKNFSMSTKTPPDIIKKIEKVADLAYLFDPFQAEYPFLKANTAWFLNDLENSKSHFISSIRLNPLKSRHLNRFGVFLANHGEPQKAQTAYKKSMLYDQSNPGYTFQYASWLFSQKDFTQGLEYMHKTLLLDEKYFSRVLTAMVASRINDTDMRHAIPDMPGPSIEYANFLSKTGSMKVAVRRYMDTLDLLENQKEPSRSHFLKIYKFFKNHNDIKNATDVIKRAEMKLPMDAGIKITLADLYYQQGIFYKALDKYDHALLLDPGNKNALRMIKKINQ